MLVNVLKDIRHEHKMEQGEFAEFLGLSKPQYNQYEKNKVQPSLETAIKIAKKVNRPVEDIFSIAPDE